MLFTDIVGSTAAGGRARRPALADAARRATTSRPRARSSAPGGRVVKTTGTASSPRSRGPAGRSHAPGRSSTATTHLGFEIRAGLHTGECELIGDDIGGMCVHLAARVCALAAPGEVLVSRTVKDLVVGSGIDFAERGAHELKGVPGTWELFAVA